MSSINTCFLNRRITLSAGSSALALTTVAIIAFTPPPAIHLTRAYEHGRLPVPPPCPHAPSVDKLCQCLVYAPLPAPSTAISRPTAHFPIGSPIQCVPSAPPIRAPALWGEYQQTPQTHH